MDTQQATTQPASPLRSWAPGPYKLGPSDTLTVTISGLAELGVAGDLTARVAQDGTVTLPMVGNVQVGGLTLEDVSTKLASAYSPQFIKDCTVQVEVATYHPTSVLVLGQVDSPGPVELRRDQRSVLQAILRAGGPTEMAADHVVLIPAATPESKQHFDIGSAAGLARAAQTDVLKEQDILWVGRRASDFVFVQGLVGAPGPVPVPRGTGLSILQAIAATGGTDSIACPTEATLYRRDDGGDTSRVKIDIKRILNGEDPDIALAAGDVLLLPHTDATRTRQFLHDNLVIRGGIDATFNPMTYYVARRYADDDDGVSSFGAFKTGFFGSLGSALAPTPPSP
jgi:polysaccharide export outer membrane protein